MSQLAGRILAAFVAGAFQALPFVGSEPLRALAE